jgi:hypothetical protein
MKTTLKQLFVIMLGVVSTFALQAQTTTVLEGFEESAPGMPPGTTTNGFSTNFCTFDGVRGYCNTNIAIFTGYGASRVTISQYTAIGPNDPNVTEGTHSMAITFNSTVFNTDFQVVLNDTNSYLVEKAAAFGQVGRYILRYDMIFSNPTQYNHFNQHVYIGTGQDYLQISAALTNGLDVYSCALELPALEIPLPNSGTNVQILFANDFGYVNGTQTSNTIYIDNIRLIDTYATPTTTPVIYPLVSFKNGIGAATNLYPAVTTYYGNPVNSRAHLSLYTTNGLYNPATNGLADNYTSSNTAAFSYPYILIPPVYSTDFAVTDGDGHALMVSNYCTGAGVDGYEADFAVSFAGTKLAQILSMGLQLPDLAHYTLRWDTTMPEEWSFEDGNYANMTFTTGSASLPMCQGRREYWGETGLQRLTYSVTLDQIAAWGGSPVGADPAIVFLFDTGDTAGPDIYFFDNFTLIDTAPVVPRITASVYNPSTKAFTLTWTSETGELYTVQQTPSLNPATWSALATDIPSGGATTGTTVTMPAGTKGFLRILAQ